MGLRPNFTVLESDGNNVSVRGISDLDDPAELADVLDIQVILLQGARVGRGAVAKIASDWVATVPVRDPDGVGPDFAVDDAVVVGIETHREHATTITWTQPMAIVDPGP
jgi:hypothetical protein